MDKRVVNQYKSKKKLKLKNCKNRNHYRMLKSEQTQKHHKWLNSENGNEIEPDHDGRRIGNFLGFSKWE
jgi:hypothetical protein